MGVKKLVTILTTSTLVMVTREKAVENGENPKSNIAQVLCIYVKGGALRLVS